MINIEYVNKMRQIRKNRITQYATDNKVHEFVAAMYIDSNGPKTTNLKMLNDAGYQVTEATLDNWEEVINNLNDINVEVIYDGLTPMVIVNKLNAALNEEIPECWGGPDMREFLDFT